MKIYFNELKEIADTLPIGLYAKRRVPVSIEEKLETSYYNPITDEIVISYDIIAEGLKNVEDIEIDYRETAIRSMVYHEVSHAIFTPNFHSVPNWLNVFEDERIETLLCNYYLDVDFKRQVLLCNGYKSIDDVGKAKDGFGRFYNIVRFRKGKQEYLDRVKELIEKYKTLTKAKYYDQYYYYREVEKLYRDIVGDETADDDGSGKESQNDSVGNNEASGNCKTYENIKSAQKSEQGESENSSASNSEADGEENGDSEDKSEARSKSSDSPLSNEEISSVFESTFGSNRYYDADLTNKLETIITNFSKKNNSGSAMSAYSGVFNPRMVGSRDDYKYWEKPSTVNGANRFGTLHLNLFIDKSGSFYYSETKMNQIIRSLTEIEKRNKNFSLDIVFCGMGEKIVTEKRKRVFHADGGNNLDEKIFGIYRKLQKPNTYNYNIACFDGDAYSDGSHTKSRGFKAFDANNCTIISDRDNERYIRKDVKNAKVIYTNDYTNELEDNIVATLQRAFR